MVPAGLACVISAASVWSAAIATRAVTRAGPRDAATAARSLSRALPGDLDAVRAALTRAGYPGSADFAASGPASDTEWILALNEHLGEVSATLSKAEPVPRAAARIALSAGGLGAVLELARLASEGQPSAAPLVAFGAGLLGAGICWELARRTTRDARGVREAWDAIAAATSKVLRAAR